jgi:hypothetical protein
MQKLQIWKGNVRKWIRYQNDDIHRLVGFRRATRPCAARTCIFRLINTRNGPLRAPTPPIAASCFSFSPPNVYAWDSKRANRVISSPSCKAPQEKICSLLDYSDLCVSCEYFATEHSGKILVGGKIREKLFRKKDATSEHCLLLYYKLVGFDCAVRPVFLGLIAHK